MVVSGSGDIGYSVGTYKGAGQDREGKTQVFEGKLVNIWHKQADGSWKVTVAMDQRAFASTALCPVQPTRQ